MGWSSDTTRQFTMSHIIADEFHSDGVEESDNNNVDESINNNVNESIDNNVNKSIDNNVNESIDNIVNESINNNVDEPINNIEVRAEGDDDVERNPMSMNRKPSKKCSAIESYSRLILGLLASSPGTRRRFIGRS